MKGFIIKAKAKMLLILRRIIFYNYSYKPVNSIESTKEVANEDKEDIRYMELYPSYHSKLDIPEEMYSIYSSFPKHKMMAHMPPAFIAEITQGRIYADNLESVAVINKNGRLLGDVSFQYTKKNWNLVPPHKNNIFRQKYFVKPKYLPGTAFSLLSGGGAAIGNYFHWVIDSLARIHLLKESDLFEAVDWFLVYNLRPDFVMDSLELLGIDHKQVVVMDECKHVQTDRLIVSSPVRGNDKHVPPWACQFLRETYLPKIKNKHSYPFIYISRSDAKARHVLNEQELITLLNNYGFKTIILSDLSFEEKIDVFSSAKVILTPIGAQLTNIVFCEKDATLIELFPAGFVLPDAVDVAKKVGMDYYYLICKNDNPSKNIADGRQEHLTVDLEEIKSLLDKVISSVPQNSLN